MSDELNTEFMIAGASFPMDLLKQMVKTDFLLCIFLPYYIFTFKHYMLDLILEIVERRLQDEGVNQVSQLRIFVVFQRVDCPEHKMLTLGHSLQPSACVTCRPRRPRGCGPRGRGGPRGPGEAAARPRRSGRPPGGCSLTARGVRWSQRSLGSLWPALCIPALNRVFCMELILIFVLFHFFAIYLEEFCTVRFYGSRHDCWRCHAGTAQWSPDSV